MHITHTNVNAYTYLPTGLVLIRKVAVQDTVGYSWLVIYRALQESMVTYSKLNQKAVPSPPGSNQIYVAIDG